jgi:hypothetical protein
VAKVAKVADEKAWFRKAGVHPAIDWVVHDDEKEK